MKRLLLFLTVATLVGCTCLSQIPDQLIPVGQSCEAILPDYSPDIIVSDNCSSTSLTQAPSPGTVLDSGQPEVLVTMTVVDADGNDASMSFKVILVDTVSPTILPGPGLLSYNEAVIGRVIRKMHYGVITMHDSILVKYPQANQDTSYRHDNLIIVSSLNTNAMPMNFVNPKHMILAADSAYMADSCGLTWQTLRLQFAQNE